MQFLKKFFFVGSLYLLMFLSKLIPYIVRRKPTNGKVLYLTAFYPGNAGYYWRVQKWSELLIEQGYQVNVKVATSKELLDNCEVEPFTFLTSFLYKRFFQVISAYKYETVIVRRELLLFNDYGDHFLEKLLSKLCAHIVLDFDDDLAASKRQPKQITNLWGKILFEDGNSFRNSFKYYNGFFVASDYLKDYILEFSNCEASQIQVIPTCVDYSIHRPKKYDKKLDKIVLGWIGGEHNYKYLGGILPDLEKLSNEFNIELNIIGGGKFPYESSLKINQFQWSLENEVNLLYKIDIGLMPLNKSEQSKGKGGFKLIQYMGLGIISVASAITINRDIIEDGITGYLVENDDWYDVLRKAIKGRDNFTVIGEKARLKILSNYSFNANFDKYKSML